MRVECHVGEIVGVHAAHGRLVLGEESLRHRVVAVPDTVRVRGDVDQAQLASSLEQVAVAAAMVEVVVRVDDDQRPVGQTGDHVGDESDSHAGVEEQRRVVAEDQEAIHVPGLRNEVNVAAEIADLEPVAGCHDRSPPGSSARRPQCLGRHPHLLTDRLTVPTHQHSTLRYVDVSNICNVRKAAFPASNREGSTV